MKEEGLRHVRITKRHTSTKINASQTGHASYGVRGTVHTLVLCPVTGRGQPAIAAARCCSNPLLPQRAIAATNFDIVLKYLDKRTNEPGRLKTTGRRACLQCTGLRVPIPADVAKTSAGGRPFSLCKRFSRQ